MAYSGYGYYSTSPYPDAPYAFGSDTRFSVQDESSSKKSRATVACSRCRQRKIKCSGDSGDGLSCTNCRNAGQPHISNCVFTRVLSTPLGYRPAISTASDQQIPYNAYPTSAPSGGGFESQLQYQPYAQGAQTASSGGPVSYQYPQSAYPSVSAGDAYYQANAYPQAQHSYGSNLSHDSGVGLASYSADWYNPTASSSTTAAPQSSKSSRGDKSKPRESSTVLGYVFEDSEPSSSSRSRRHKSSRTLDSMASTTQLAPLETSGLYPNNTYYDALSTARSGDDNAKASSSSGRRHHSSSSRHGDSSRSSHRHRSGDEPSSSSSQKHHGSSSSRSHHRSK